MLTKPSGERRWYRAVQTSLFREREKIPRPTSRRDTHSWLIKNILFNECDEGANHDSATREKRGCEWYGALIEARWKGWECLRVGCICVIARNMKAMCFVNAESEQTSWEQSTGNTEDQAGKSIIISLSHIDKHPHPQEVLLSSVEMWLKNR